MVNFTKYSRIADYTFFKSKGKVENVVGLTIESAGPEAKLEIGRASCRERV